MDFTAQSLYGSFEPAQPVPAGQAPEANAAAPSPAQAQRVAHFGMTKAPAGGAGGNPTFALVALLAVAALLINFSVSGSFSVKG